MFPGPVESPADVQRGRDAADPKSLVLSLTLMLRLPMALWTTLTLMLTRTPLPQQCSWQRFLERHLIGQCRLGLFVRRPTIMYCRLRVFPHRLLHLFGVYFPVTLFPVREVALHPLTMAG